MDNTLVVVENRHNRTGARHFARSDDRYTVSGSDKRPHAPSLDR
jgi:hypothetical protein